MMKRMLFGAAAILLLGATFFVVGQNPSSSKPTKAEKPDVVGVLFYADWCASCKVLEPKLKEVMRDYRGKKILFTRFDLTDDFTKEQSLLYASWVGFDKIYLDNPQTGFMLLVTPSKKRVLGTLTKDLSVSDLRKGIDTALKQARSNGGGEQEPAMP